MRARYGILIQSSEEAKFMHLGGLLLLDKVQYMCLVASHHDFILYCKSYTNGQHVLFDLIRLK
jgi:hypothetical protein